MPLKKNENGTRARVTRDRLNDDETPPWEMNPNKPSVPTREVSGGAVTVPAVDDGFGEMSSASYEMPRMKLLHGVSPEVQHRVHPDAQAGIFWHCALNESLGQSVKVVAVRQTPYWALLEPGSGKLLAKANLKGEWLDGAAHGEYRVEIGRRPVTWLTKGSLAESGLSVLGSSGGYWSAATPAFDVVLWLEGREDAMPVMMTFKKTAARPLRELFTIIDMRKNSGIARHAQSFNLRCRQVQGKEAMYWVPFFENAGIIRDQEHVNFLQKLAVQLSGAQIRVVGDDDAGEAVVKPQGPASYDANDGRDY